MFNIRGFIKQHRFQIYDELCLASLPILVYNGERSRVGMQTAAELSTGMGSHAGAWEPGNARVVIYLNAPQDTFL
jgi:hypothetical protein